jgi:hypothetical protein
MLKGGFNKMAITFEDWPKSLLLTGLFLMCIIGFMNGLGANYGEDLTTPYIDTSRVEAQINKTSSDANDWAEAFKSDNLFVTTGTIVILSIWGVVKLVWDAIVTFITIYLDIMTALFGIPPIVTGVITALVIISLVFLAWKTIKQG